MPRMRRELAAILETPWALMPATLTRLKDNVETETKGKVGMRALTAVVHHPWIKRLLPERTALLRAPAIEQIILEDWLLER